MAIATRNQRRLDWKAKANAVTSFTLSAKMMAELQNPDNRLKDCVYFLAHCKREKLDVEKVLARCGGMVRLVDKKKINANI